VQSEIVKSIEDTNLQQSKQVDSKFEGTELKISNILKDTNLKHGNQLDSNLKTIKSELTKTVEDIKLKISDHCKQVKAKIASLTSDTLMDTTPSPNNPNLSHKDISQAVSSVFNEEKEKNKRKLNLILHNIPESNAEIADQWKQHYTDTAMAIINQHQNIPTSISNVIKLGKKIENSDKPRLLRITVDSDQAKVKILHNCTKICSFSDPEYLQQVFLTPDQTPKEREANKLLRSK